MHGLNQILFQDNIYYHQSFYIQDLVHNLNLVFDNLKILNFEDYYNISYLDIIFEYCPSLTFLSDKYYPLKTDILINFKTNMPNCEIILYKI